MNFNFESFSIAHDATIDPVSVRFDKYGQSPEHRDVTVKVALDGNTLDAVRLDDTSLVPDADFTVSGNTVTLSKDYLKNLPIGTYTFVFDMDLGIDPELAVKVYESGTIDPVSVRFDKHGQSSNHRDVTVTVALNGNTLDAVRLGTETLTRDTDYTVSVTGDEVTLKKGYLARLPIGVHTFTFDMDMGMDPELVVTVSDTAPSNPPIYLPVQQEPENPASSKPVWNESAVNEDEVVQWFASRAEEVKAGNAEETEFADTAGHWAEKAIRSFAQLRLAEGYPDGTFKPDRPITRAEFAALLDRVFRIAGGNASVALQDIEGSWAKESIEKRASAGVISGYPDGTFRPDQTITRQEMVVILTRIVNLESLEKDPAKGEFHDLGNAYAAEAIREAAQAGIVSGKGNGVFDPGGSATRAEALQMIINVLKLNPAIKELLETLEM